MIFTKDIPDAPSAWAPDAENETPLIHVGQEPISLISCTVEQAPRDNRFCFSKSATTFHWRCFD